MREIEGMESFDALLVAEAAATGEWVLVVLVDDSGPSEAWQDMLADELVAECLENYTTFVLNKEADPEEAEQVMSRWEVVQLPAMVVVAPDGGAFNEFCLTSDSVDAPEDIAQWLDDQAGFLSGPDLEDEPEED